MLAIITHRYLNLYLCKFHGFLQEIDTFDHEMHFDYFPVYLVKLSFIEHIINFSLLIMYIEKKSFIVAAKRCTHFVLYGQLARSSLTSITSINQSNDKWPITRSSVFRVISFITYLPIWYGAIPELRHQLLLLNHIPFKLPTWCFAWLV